MDNNGKKPIEKEYLSSQMYKSLTGVGIPAADKLAEGLGKAAAGLDAALNSAVPAVRSAAQTAAKNFQATQGTYRYKPGVNPVNNQNRPPQPAPNASTSRTTQTTQATQSTQVNQSAQSVHTVPPPAQGTHNGPASGPHIHRPPKGVTPVPPPRMPPKMKVVHRGSAAKYYITSIVAIVYAMSAQMTEPLNFVMFAAVVLLTFLLSNAIFRGKKQLVPVEEPAPKKQEEPKPEPKPEPQKKSATGNPEVDKIIDDGHDMIKKLRAANDAIPDEALSADIDRMERASTDIFNYIAKHPGKAPQIRKFMNYYLPTTLKLLGSYEQLSKQSVKGENITSTMFNIAGMMHTVADAFEKQLDSLFTDEAMDISADITVFETMLKQEGFVEEKKGL